MIAKRIPKMIGYDKVERRAHILIGEEVRWLPTRCIDGDPKRYLVSGFACAFETGLKVWRGDVTFREVTEGVFSYYDLNCYDFVPPGRGLPPHIVGFFEGIAQSDKGHAQGSTRDRRWASIFIWCRPECGWNSLARSPVT